MTGYERKQLIIGIDPGTTTAYAILNVYGRVIAVRSSKKLKLDDVIKETTDIGIPLIVGTDRKKCPSLVQKFAARTGAKIAMPEQDVSTMEKNAITRAYELKDAHQKDALASALLAFKQYESLLNRIDKTLKLYGKQEHAEEVKSVVIRKKISIQKAIAFIEKNLPLVRAY